MRRRMSLPPLRNLHFSIFIFQLAIPLCIGARLSIQHFRSRQNARTRSGVGQGSKGERECPATLGSSRAPAALHLHGAWERRLASAIENGGQRSRADHAPLGRVRAIALAADGESRTPPGALEDFADGGFAGLQLGRDPLDAPAEVISHPPHEALPLRQISL